MAVRFSPDVVEDVRTQTDIVEVVSDHVALRRSGRNYVGLCPFHAEKTPSFTVTREKQMFHCFGCQTGGDVFSFIMKLTGVDFPHAVEQLAERAGIDVTPARISPAEQRRMEHRRRLLDVHREVAAFYTRMLHSPVGQPARDYLRRRTIDAGTVERFQLGYAPRADVFRRFLQERGINDDTALEAGLLVPGRDGRAPFPRFRERLMFPIWDRGGRVIGFGGRLLADGVNAPKYLNSPETPLFAKRRTIYGAHLARSAAREAGQVIVVEGYTDCLRLSQHGVQNVVASLGTAFTPQQAAALGRIAGRAVIAFDGDTAGEAATLRSLEVLTDGGLRVAVMPLPDNLDPDDFIVQHGAAALREAIRTVLPLTEYKLNIVLADIENKNIEERARAVEAAVGIITTDVTSAVEREGYVELVAERCGVHADTIRAEMARTARKQQQNGKSRHSPGKKRHNNKGIPTRHNEQTIRDHSVEGIRLLHAEQVVLRHVLVDGSLCGTLRMLDRSDAWSNDIVAEAVAALRRRVDESEPSQWLSTLPDGRAAALLRQIWADHSLAEVPWKEACRELWRERGRRWIRLLERRLHTLAEAESEATASRMLLMLLVEYKRLRSLLGEQAQ